MICNIRTVLGLISLMFFLLMPGSSWSANNGPVAVMNFGGSIISWAPMVSYDRLVLTVSQPDGAVLRKEFGAGVSPSIATPVVDGQYTYELKVVPFVDPSARKVLAAARQSGDMTEVNSLRAAGMLPSKRLVQSGHFRIQGGSFIQVGEIVE